MAMNKQRKTSNLLNILSYDDAGNIVLRDYSQTIRYNWNGTIHAFTGPLSVSSIAAAVTDTDRFLVSDGGVLKYRTGAEVLSDIGAFILPSLTSGSVLFSNGTTIAQNNANFFWDAANNRLGIGTNAPSRALDVRGSARIETASTTELDLIGGGSNILRVSVSATTPFIGTLTNAPLGFFTSATERARVSTNGNLLVGTTTDGGQRLQVQGDAFIKGSGATSATNSLTVQNSDGNNILRLRNDLAALFNFVGTSLTMSGEANYTIMLANQAFYFRSNGGTAGRAFKIFDNASSLTGTSGANQNIQSLITFAPTSGTATYTDLDLSSTINQTGGANGITRGLYVRPTLTAAADWRSIEWSNNSGWGLYGAGTANNYLGGSLGIGATTLTGYNLRISKDISGASGFYGLSIDGLINPSVTSFYASFFSRPSFQTTTFNLSTLLHFGAYRGNISGGATVTDQYGFLASGELIGATNNYGFFGSLPNGTGNWNLYMNGTADNYLRGKLLINTTTVGTFNLDVNGTARVSGASTFGGTLNINTAVWLQFNGANVLLGEGTNTFLQANGGGSIIFRNNTPSELMRLTAGGNLLVGTTADQGYRVQITGSGDNMLNVWGATAPSIRLDNAASGATQRFVIGLATATNNFIQGANAGDVCMTPGTSSALVFGMWQTSSSSEVMRISTSSNVLIGKNTDSGQKLQVVGKVNLTSLPTSATGLIAGDIWNNGGVLNIV